MYMYEVFTGSISQEENWKDSVNKHNNEHMVFWAISMYFVWGQSKVHLFRELDKLTPWEY